MTKKKVAILASGDEIITGRLIDTNSAWISKFVQELGYEISYIAAAGDNEYSLKELILFVLKFSDLVFITGGLGPTEDDKTRYVLAQITNSELQFNEEAHQQMLSYFKKIGRDISTVPSSNQLQNMIPIGSNFIPNLCGTACGIVSEFQNKNIIAVPGVPHEMKSMIDWVSVNMQHVLPRVQPAHVIKIMTLFGVSEARIGERIKQYMKANKPIVGITAKSGYIQVSVMDFSESIVQNTFDEIKLLLTDCLISETGQTPAEKLIEICRTNQWKLGCIESCTGGLIADAFVNIPGASDVFYAGAVSYSNEAKNSMAGVSLDTINSHGAVSEEVVKEMAKGFLMRQNLNVCLSSSGVAGPGGGTIDKPVGMVCLGVAINENVYAFTTKFGGNRQEVRIRSVNYVLGNCILILLGKLNK